MTIIISHKEYKGLDGRTWFVERYKEEWQMSSFYRYGYINKIGLGVIKSHTLWSRPNLKKLNII